MPDTLRNSALWHDLKAEGVDPELVEDIRSAVLAEYDTLTAAVEGLTLYDENARTMADAAESMRSRAVAILRGEPTRDRVQETILSERDPTDCDGFDPDALAEAEFLKPIKPQEFPPLPDDFDPADAQRKGY